MKKFKLTRVYENDICTLGVITDETGWVCNTLELPWKNNTVDESRIPAGEYVISPYKSPRHGECFLIDFVPGRAMVEIHPGNCPEDTNGCILPGLAFGDNKVMYSVPALQKLKTITLFEPFALEIKDCF